MKCSMRSSVRNNTWPSCSVTNCLAAYWQKAVRSHVDVVHFLCADNVDDEDDIGTIKELEKIDDDCDRNGIPFVKINNLAEAEQYGLESLPALVYFENKIPNIYEGNSFRLKLKLNALN